MPETLNVSTDGHVYLHVNDGFDADVRSGGCSRMCFQIIMSVVLSAMGRFYRSHGGGRVPFAEFLGAQAL